MVKKDNKIYLLRKDSYFFHYSVFYHVFYWFWWCCHMIMQKGDTILCASLRLSRRKTLRLKA